MILKPALFLLVSEPLPAKFDAARVDIDQIHSFCQLAKHFRVSSVTAGEIERVRKILIADDSPNCSFPLCADKLLGHVEIGPSPMRICALSDCLPADDLIDRRCDRRWRHPVSMQSDKCLTGSSGDFRQEKPDLIRLRVKCMAYDEIAGRRVEFFQTSVSEADPGKGIAGLSINGRYRKKPCAQCLQ